MAPHIASAGSSTGLVDKLASVLDKTGYILPALALTLIILVILYPDRVLFTAPYVKEVPVAPGADPPVPLLGHTLAIVRGGLDKQFEGFKGTTDLSPIGAVQMSLLSLGKIFVFVRPEYIEAIQKANFESFQKGPDFRERFAEVLGHQGIFVADGDTWKVQRKRASHIFSAGQFRTWVQQVVHDELKLVVSVLDQIAAKKKAGARNNRIMLPDLFFRYTLSSFAKMAFSYDMGALTSSADCLDREVEFSTAFDFAQNVIGDRFILPGWKLHEWVRPDGYGMRRAAKTLRKEGMKIIADRVEARKAGGKVNEKRAGGIQKDGRDLLDLFMDIDLDSEYLYFTTMNFLIAGRDTTAQSLSWFFYELFRAPHHVDEIIKECEAVIDGGFLDYDDIKKLPYTQACIAEAIRLHPSVPKNGYQAIKDCVLRPEGPNAADLPDVVIRKGEWTTWCDWAMARRTDVWGPDAEEYNPNRFIEVDPKTGARSYKVYNQFQFHSFNGGPRLCLGMNLAFYEAMAITAVMLPRFKVSWTSKENGQTASWPLNYVSSVTHPCEPYLADIELRE